MATGDTPLHVYDGDIIQLYCPLESGYVYSEPNSTSDLELDIVSKDKIKIADFAAFSITLKKESTNENHSKRKGSTTAVTEKIAYGSIVSLKHQASNNVMTGKNKEVKLSSSKAAVKLSSSKAATASDDNRMPQLLFRVVSPNHELEWGEELQDNYLIKLKLISDNNSLVYFYYDHQRKFYRPTLRASGTVFNVKVYCHEYLRQNPKSIKGGSPIIISTLLNIEGYLCATGSFFSSKFDEIERTSGHEQTSGSYSRSLEEPTEQQSRIKQQSGVEQPEEYLKYSLTKEDSHKEEMKGYGLASRIIYTTLLHWIKSFFTVKRFTHALLAIKPLHWQQLSFRNE